MAGEWIECKLADACSSIDYGLTASASDGEAGPRFLRITDIVSGHIDWKTVPRVVTDKQTTEKYRLYDGDIVLARTGASTGVSSYVKNPPESVFASYLVRLRATPHHDSHFLAYYLKSDEFWSFIRGVLGDKSAQPNASASTMTQAPLRAPKDKDEQRAIADILGTLDDKIELNRRMNETLEAMARAIFKSWFVDFDPVRAKAEGRQPFGMDAPTAALFPDSFQDSPLGKIPKGWKVGPIGDFVTVVGGSTPSTKEPKFWNGSIHFATPKDMSSLQFPILLETERRITEEGLQQISSGLLPKGTVLLSSRAPIGYLAVTEIPVAVNQGMIAIICDKELPNLYVLHWVKENLETIIANANGTTFLEISKANFRPIPAIVPPPPVLKRFTEIVGPLHRLMVNNARQSQTLAAIRDALLPKLISGEIRIKDAERLAAQTT